jgi:hypothetical protein
LRFGTARGGIGAARALAGIPFVVARSRLLPSVEGRLLIDGPGVVIRRGRGTPCLLLLTMARSSRWRS